MSAVAQTLGSPLLRLAPSSWNNMFAAESRPKLHINAALDTYLNHHVISLKQRLNAHQLVFKRRHGNRKDRLVKTH
jgi:hypothetical protein